MQQGVYTYALYKLDLLLFSKRQNERERERASCLRNIAYIVPDMVLLLLCLIALENGRRVMELNTHARWNSTQGMHTHVLNVFRTQNADTALKQKKDFDIHRMKNGAAESRERNPTSPNLISKIIHETATWQTEMNWNELKWTRQADPEGDQVSGVTLTREVWLARRVRDIKAYGEPKVNCDTFDHSQFTVPH